MNKWTKQLTQREIVIMGTSILLGLALYHFMIIPLKKQKT